MTFQDVAQPSPEAFYTEVLVLKVQQVDVMILFNHFKPQSLYFL